MKPYYQDAQVTLYLSDCRDILPLLPPNSVDLILTDPPYGQNWQSHLRKAELFPVLAGDDGELPLHDLLALALRTLRRGRHIYVFGLDNFGELPIGGHTELVWDKALVGPGDLTLPWGPSHERILFGVHQFSKASREDGDGRLSARLRRGSVLRSQRANGSAVTVHPTEKPVDILRQMIESSTMLGETVLDPFCGSGSTLEAALLEDRKSIGIEVDERYAEVAARRICRLPFEVPAHA